MGQKDKDRWRQEISTIEQNYLWCSHYKKMNDPMEGSYEAEHPDTNLLAQQDQQPYIEALTEIFYGKASFGICCFTETNNNDLMWAHYSSGFSGICVQYDLNKLLASLDSNGNDTGSLVRVTYVEDLCQISLADNEGPSHPQYNDIARRVLSFKSYRWAYEREWRLFRHGGEGKMRIAQNCISRIFVGNRMKKEALRRLLKDLRDTNIPVSKMELDGYTIGFSELKGTTATATRISQ